MLVSPPVGTSVMEPGSAAMIVSTMNCAAGRGSSWIVGSGSTGPSSPDSPWISAAVSISRTSGRAEPAANGHADDPGDAGDRQRVARDLVERLVAHDGRDADQFDLGAAPGQHHRDGVVVPGIAVEDDLRRHVPSLRAGRFEA